MSYLEPPRHGGGGDDPHIPFLHFRFLYMKYCRYLSLIGVIGMTVMTIQSIITNQHSEDVFGIPLTDEIAPVYLSILLVLMLSCFYYIYTRPIARMYKLLKYAHFSYCKCDKTKWWNKS